jgi:hypothetical protein
MENPEKVATYVIQDEEKQNKIFVRHHYAKQIQTT